MYGKILSNKNSQLHTFHPHDEPVTHLHGAILQCCAAYRYREHVSKHSLLGWIISSTRSSAKHSRWYTDISKPRNPIQISQCLISPWLEQTYWFTFNLLLCFCWRFSLPLFSLLQFSPSHFQLTEIYIQGRLGALCQSRRWKEEESCVPCQESCVSGKVMKEKLI